MFTVLQNSIKRDSCYFDKKRVFDHLVNKSYTWGKGKGVRGFYCRGQPAGQTSSSVLTQSGSCK